jgi:hypothetical protein
LRPSRFERLRDDLNHCLVLEQRVDAPQPVGPQFVAIGQQHFEQTPLALSASDHARSFVIDADKDRNVDPYWQMIETTRSVRSRSRGSMDHNDLARPFFTGK